MRTRLRPRTDDEASALVKEKFGSLAFLTRDGDDIVAKRCQSTPSLPGGQKIPLAPPATAGSRDGGLQGEAARAPNEVLHNRHMCTIRDDERAGMTIEACR